MNRITLQDLAARLGLSVSAVSLGLRHSPKIAPATRRKIGDLAQRLGYRPHPILSELASSRWRVTPLSRGNVIAHIDCSRPGDWPRLLIPTLQEEASTFGYRLEPFFRAEFSSSAKLERVLRNRGITDVILGPLYDETLSVQLSWRNFICIQLLSGLSQLPLHNVVKDHFNAVKLAWQQAVSRGYRRIGLTLLDHSPPVQDDIIRLSAAYACQHHYHGHLPRLPIFHYHWNLAPPRNVAHRAAFREWIKACQPDVLIDFIGYHQHILRAEYSGKFPLISLHVNENPPNDLSGILEDGPNCAREAINLLHFCRRTHQWGIPQRRIDHVIEPIWCEGKTLPRKKRLGAGPKLLRRFDPVRSQGRTAHRPGTGTIAAPTV